MKSIVPYGLIAALVLSFTGCMTKEPADSPGEFEPGQKLQPGADPAENTAIGGGIAAFYEPIRAGQIPSPNTLTSHEFLDQFNFALPPPECELDLCLHASLARHPTFISKQPSTMVTLGLNSAVDPATLAGAPRHIALVIDTSQAMRSTALQDVHRALTVLVGSLKAKDQITIFAVGTQANLVVDEAGDEELDLQNKLVAVGEFNLYDGLRRGLDHLSKFKQDNRRSILISIAASNPSAGIIQQARLQKLVSSYPDLDHDFHAIAVGQGLDPQDYRALARAAGGHFHFIDSTQHLGGLLRGPQTLNRVTLARNIDIRLQLGSGYQLRGVFGANIHSQNESHVTVRVPSFDLVAQPGEDTPSTASQKVVVVELQAQPQARDRVAELDFSYLKDTEDGEKRIQGQSRLVLAPTADQGIFFESDAARRSFGLISIFTAYQRTLTLIAQEDLTGAWRMLYTLREALTNWLNSPAADQAVANELVTLKALQDLVSDDPDQEQPGQTPVIDPIIDPAPLR